jgi:predicted sulfurtransferase
MSDGNSIIPTEEDHDDHHAHLCADCEMPFSRNRRLAGECAEGDLCADCWEARGEGEE